MAGDSTDVLHDFLTAILFSSSSSKGTGLYRLISTLALSAWSIDASNGQ
jgi:hypothetical protein